MPAAFSFVFSARSILALSISIPHLLSFFPDDNSAASSPRISIFLSFPRDIFLSEMLGDSARICKMSARAETWAQSSRPHSSPTCLLGWLPRAIELVGRFRCFLRAIETEKKKLETAVSSSPTTNYKLSALLSQSQCGKVTSHEGKTILDMPSSINSLRVNKHHMILPVPLVSLFCLLFFTFSLASQRS